MGGGRRGGGRREKRGWRREKRGREEGEGRKKGREGERGNFCARQARAAPEGRRETRGREGEVRGQEGREAYPPLSTPSYIQRKVIGLLCIAVCDPDTYGKDCAQQCGFCSNCLCSPINGSCLQGCRNGWTSIKCNIGMFERKQNERPLSRLGLQRHYKPRAPIQQGKFINFAPPPYLRCLHHSNI